MLHMFQHVTQDHYIESVIFVWYVISVENFAICQVGNLLSKYRLDTRRRNLKRVQLFTEVQLRKPPQYGSLTRPNFENSLSRQIPTKRKNIFDLPYCAYPTPDGTGVRDYIHVVDLAAGHVAALNYLERQGGLLTVNLGTGRGYSVLDMVRAFSAANGREIPYRIAGRRVGDIAQCWADPTLANRLLGWQATRGLEAMCADAWRWQQFAEHSLRAKA